ncbi:aspartyl-phosphate phosphatase Spo0E family protein [Paenibacillus puldeungensis]|uniref:Aspartyl-phosphate phosphatase Spo0E family protein n=1 Tax=Paenibacillus puldeungensis TaxID=696536 RepID=A0ABW3RZY5_9BACL
MVSQSYGSTRRSNNRISNDLKATIEHLRSELMSAATGNNFNSGTILELSQRLDQYIVLAQNQMLGK